MWLGHAVQSVVELDLVDQLHEDESVEDEGAVQDTRIVGDVEDLVCMEHQAIHNSQLEDALPHNPLQDLHRAIQESLGFALLRDHARHEPLMLTHLLCPQLWPPLGNSVCDVRDTGERVELHMPGMPGLARFYLHIEDLNRSRKCTFRPLYTAVKLQGSQEV